MVILPENFDMDNLKANTPEQIMTVIRGLKQEINRLKYIAEHPDYKYREISLCPTENTQIQEMKLYIERAKQALVEVGGEYTPSLKEQKAIEFNDNIPYINKMEFCIGGYFGGYETKTYTIDGDKVYLSREHSLDIEPADNCTEMETLTKEELLSELEGLHIGEWRKNYNTRRFGITVFDGTQWEFKICFSNGHKPVEISGDNAYPYNFYQLLELFNIEK